MGVHREIHHPVGDQEAVHRVVLADVVAEPAVPVEVPDRAAGGVSGQHAIVDEADRRHPLQQGLVAPGVDQLARAVENLNLAQFAGIYGAIGRDRHGEHRPGGGPPALDPAGRIEHLDLGIAGRQELPARVHCQAAERGRELAGRAALAADDISLPVFHGANSSRANVQAHHLGEIAQDEFAVRQCHGAPDFLSG